MDLNNVKKIMQMSSQLQSRMTEMQDRLAEQRFTASSGGGLVEATVDGKGAIQTIQIDEGALSQTTARKLEEKVLTAVTQAQKLANKAMEAEMKKATGGLSLPGLGSLMGS